MVKELKLKGNELIVYAIIYGFAQAENQCFNGSLSYLAEWTSATKQGIMKNLKSLIEKRLIDKTEKYVNGVKFVEYRTTQFNGDINKVSSEVVNSVEQGGKQSLPNKIEDNKIDNDNIKHKYGEFKNVLLTDEEYRKIQEKGLTYLIEELSGYIESTGKKYQSHYATILNWSRKNPKKELEAPSFDIGKYEDYVNNLNLKYKRKE